MVDGVEYLHDSTTNECAPKETCTLAIQQDAEVLVEVQTTLKGFTEACSSEATNSTNLNID